MENVTIILILLPTPKGPVVQREIYARGVIMDSGSRHFRYTTLEGRPSTLIISGNLFVILETLCGNEDGND